MTATLERIPVERISPHDRNVRRDLGDLTELAASIKGVGVLQPLTVAPVPLTREQVEGATTLPTPQYVLIAGHRRLAAAIQAGEKSVPCVVRDDLDTTAKQIESMLVENLQRTDLTVMEEADAYVQLELLGVKEAGIAKATGRSRATVHQRLMLAGLPAERREQFETGNLSLDGAVQCAKLRQQWADDPEILDIIDKSSTWSFGSNYGVKSRIDRILADRKRAAEPAPEPQDEDDEYDPEDGQSTVDGQIRESVWEARQKAARAAHARMYDWLSGRVTAKDRTVLSALLDLAIDAQVCDYEMRGLPELFGIEPEGQDEDRDDAARRIAASLKALDVDDRTMFVAIALADIASPIHYATDRLDAYVQLGYTLTNEDRACMEAEAQS